MLKTLPIIPPYVPVIYGAKYCKFRRLKNLELLPNLIKIAVRKFMNAQKCFILKISNEAVSNGSNNGSLDINRKEETKYEQYHANQQGIKWRSKLLFTVIYKLELVYPCEKKINLMCCIRKGLAVLNITYIGLGENPSRNYVRFLGTFRKILT